MSWISYDFNHILSYNHFADTFAFKLINKLPK